MFTQEHAQNEPVPVNLNQRDSVASVTSLETSQTEGNPRRSSAVRLPPLSRDKGGAHSEMSSREGSGDSVTSARKVNVDVTPTIGRTRRVGDIYS